MWRKIQNVLAWFGSSTKAGLARNKSPRRPLRGLTGFEALEDRKLFAHLAVLNFGGGTVTGQQQLDGHWNPQSNLSVAAFSSLFTSANPLLDMNGDAAVNSTDAQLAINKIVLKVKQDYAPYDIDVVSGSFATRPAILVDAQQGDVMVMVTGGPDIINANPANGVSPHTDLGNERDELAWVFGKQCMNGMTSGEMVINSIARSISHEMGHCFGLGHITVTPAGMADAHSHALMGVVLSASDPAHRDYSHDFVIQDITYQTDATGPSAAFSSLHPELNVANQNPHLYLSNPAVLGPSTKAWMAMLRPGELTIMGDDDPNTITVSQSFKWNWFNQVEVWNVSVSSEHNFGHGTVPITTTIGASLDMTHPGINSFNPYSVPVSKIFVTAKGGSDTITVASGITASLTARGGSGWDTITGGGGDDFLFGDSENDKLYGGLGNDRLYGGLGSDELHGQGGSDSLYGDSPSTDDGVIDYLYGELGNDTFYQKKSYIYAPLVQDSYVDFNSAEDSIVRFELVLERR